MKIENQIHGKSLCAISENQQEKVQKKQAAIFFRSLKLNLMLSFLSEKLTQ